MSTTNLTYTMYGIKNCDTIKKARKWLDDNHIPYVFHDYRKDGLKEALLLTLPLCLINLPLLNVQF